MSWENQNYHHHLDGGVFSVRKIESGHLMSAVPYLCIWREGAWHPVARFINHKRAQEFCDFFEKQLDCQPVTEN